MILWLDAQISPKPCAWIRRQFGLGAAHVRDLALRNAADREIFQKAREADVVVLTKDEDFVLLVQRLGPPPRVIWLTCGNAPNARVKKILTDALPDAIALLERGEPLVEIAEGHGGRRASPARRSGRIRKG